MQLVFAPGGTSAHDALFDLICNHISLSLGHLGPPLGHLEPHLGHLAPHLGHLEPHLGPKSIPASE